MTIQYANAHRRPTVLFVALRGSQCCAQVGEDEDQHQCPFQARYLVVGRDNGDVVGFCGLHVNDSWRDMIEDGQTIGQNSWDALDTYCDSDLDTVSALDRQDIGCPYRAQIVLDRTDGTQFAACRHHAHDSWFEHLELDDDTESDSKAAESDVDEVEASAA